MSISYEWFKEYVHRARELGLYMDTYSPGDGVTRYRFCDKHKEYFTMGHGAIFTAMGRREAALFLKGFLAGCYHD